ncbi:hypothetical protein DERP_002131 [Dermatophagoides pteronyssinus]|uniref:Uncharacterized protein n=1 Tax=Dermatophagoides pteronyssinus TaxID=6956 RepID=A0ABQ8JHN7_DERPT|nr:hypothetical protein DERP_002131 [Dermatophagoides pteronyssinus]
MANFAMCYIQNTTYRNKLTVFYSSSSHWVIIKRKNFRGDNNNDGDDDGMNGSNEVHETTIHSHFAASSHKLYIKDQTGQVTFHRDVKVS